MLLYWGMFTVGFLFGSILAFITFAPKKPEEDDVEYEKGLIRDYKGQLGDIKSKNDNDLSRILFSSQRLNQSHEQEISPANNTIEDLKLFPIN